VVGRHEADVLRRELQRDLGGQAHFDDLTRTLYATDASIYEILPVGVLVPRNTADVAAAVQACGRAGVSVTPRGAGTGLAGGAVGPGLQIDLSRHFRHIADLDPVKRTVRVGAGVVLDELNAVLAPHGLQFAPDVATSSRATLGGMIANNSCGAHSVIYGRTVDHVWSLTCVLSDGSVVTWSRDETARVEGGAGAARSELPERIVETLDRVRNQYREQIEKRYPKILRKNGGYGLDRLLTGGAPVNPCTIICGSEGTLCIVVEAVLNLIPLPRHKALLLLQYDELLAALGEVPAILQHGPAAVELTDRMLLAAARRAQGSQGGGARANSADMLTGDPAGVLVAELYDDDARRLGERLDGLDRAMAAAGTATRRTRVTDPAQQAGVWDLRKRGLGLLMSRPGDEQPYGFAEDTAVDPARLRDYIERFGQVLGEHGVREVSYWAHASVGCLHVRPVLNLKRRDDVERMRRIGDAVSSLVLEFGGAMTAEHGDGIVRSCWLEKMYGPELIQAFKEVKSAFDPRGLMNPGKIVDPWPMNENLRYGGGYETRQVKTHLDFSVHGGMAGLAQMCSGVGQCRQRMTGTMCPSFIATGDERHTTRARANAVRIALSNRGLLDGLGDPRLDDVMDLCLSCKACRSECPTGVDLARIKAEWLANRNRRLGVPRRARLVADTPRLAVWGSRLAPLSNWLLGSSWVRGVFERRYGLDRRVPPPRFVHQTFHAWFDRHRRRARANGRNTSTQGSSARAAGFSPRGLADGLNAPQERCASPGRAPRGRVVYFVDCWTNHYRPEVGVATVRLLEAAGFDVLAPRLQCCGRPMISKGLLAEAAYLADLNVRRLAMPAAQRVPVVGTEPSCILTLVDEYPQLVRTVDAQQLAGVATMAESLLARVLREDPTSVLFTGSGRRLLYHGHCHQKALVGTQDAVELLNRPAGFETKEIPSGCCGMAGSFGHEVEHYEVSRAIGEERLFPAVRHRDGAEIAVSGFSCREQIAHHCEVGARHVVEYLAEALAPPPVS